MSGPCAVCGFRVALCRHVCESMEDMPAVIFFSVRYLPHDTRQTQFTQSHSAFTIIHVRHGCSLLPKIAGRRLLAGTHSPTCNARLFELTSTRLTRGTRTCPWRRRRASRSSGRTPASSARRCLARVRVYRVRVRHGHGHGHGRGQRLGLRLAGKCDAVVGGDVLQLGRDLRVGRPARPIVVELARGDLTWWD
eukprot:scaffold72485_cov58-Phaeocystis_antarctica.AAC.3